MVLYNLNSNFCFGILYRELKDDWTNSILMSYLPPFTTGKVYTHTHIDTHEHTLITSCFHSTHFPLDLEMRNPVFSLSLREVEMDMDVA